MRYETDLELEQQELDAAELDRDETEDQTMEWLLSRDLSEPEETLFALDRDEPLEQTLSELEAELANRPMERGAGQDAGFAGLVEEEIIMTGAAGEFDIYSDEQDRPPVQEAPKSPAPFAVVDHTVLHARDLGDVLDLGEGTDILGLAEEDDMGEKHLVLKKVQVQKPEPPQPAPGEQEIDTASGDVHSYINGKPAPSNEEEFDRYLLEGQHLDNQSADIGELQVEATEGVPSVDPTTDADIDYHEDFTSMEGFGSASVSLIAEVLAATMEELLSAVTARGTALGLSPDDFSVDVMLGNDAASISQCVRAGYAPVAEVCPELPAALRRLGPAELAAIYVCITNPRPGVRWNRLLQEDFSLPVAQSSAVQEAWLSEQDFLIDDAGEDELEWPSDAGEEQDAEPAALADSGPDFGLELEFEGSEELLPEPVMASGEEAPADEPNGETSGDQEPEVEEQIESVFDDDIFSQDVSEELAAADPDTADVDAMLEQLTAPVEAVSDELIQLAEEELAAAPEPVPSSEPEPAPESAAPMQPEAWYIPDGIRFNLRSEDDGELFADFLDAFIEEAASELEKLEEVIGRWEKDVANEAVFAHVPRTLHNLKGIAKGVGLQCYGTLIHNFESLVEGMARPAPGAEGDYFRVINVWLDAALRGFDQIQDGRTDIASEFPSGVADLAPAEVTAAEPDTSASPAVEPAAAEPEAERPAPAVEKRPEPKRPVDDAADLASQRSIRLSADAVDNLLNLTSQAQQLGVRTSQSTLRAKRSASELSARLSLVRAHIAKVADRALMTVSARGERLDSALDALEMDQYSELQEAANILREGVEDLDDLIHLVGRQNSQSEALLKQQASVISSLNAAIQAARVIPVSRLMPGLRRIVRRVGNDTGKQVAFSALNEAGSLDRDNFNRCQIILEHMVRNAVDHGIESPAERTAAGKSACGQVSVDVMKEGGDYLISLSDDGRGINADNLRERAYELGLDVDADALSDAQALRLIFHKGFTTARTVSEISGRGVGMDIVLNELQQIGGEVDIESTPGEGTTFRIRIPSNVTVNGALLVQVGEASYAIPLDGVIAVEHVPVAEFFKALETGGTLSLLDMHCEPVYLATLCNGEGLPDRSVWNQTLPVMIAGSEERRMAIAVDDVQQALELVIRSLGPQFNGVPGLAGATTTAEGEAVVALDLNALVRSYGFDPLSTVAANREQPERLLVLVVDDSRTQRLVATSQLDSIGVETVTAENGLVAIDLLNTTHRLPDVILLDIEMPVKDGIQTLREIRKSMRYRHIPVIMVTSRTGAKHRALAENAGCNGYMGKPFNFPMLVDQIAQFTGFDLSVG